MAVWLGIISSVLTIIAGIFYVYQKNQKTPSEIETDLIGAVNNAFQKAEAKNKDGKTSDDTSSIEDIVNH